MTASADGAQHPAPLSHTSRTFPVSCPGIAAYNTIGQPAANASQMVPGPALVTSADAARIMGPKPGTNP